MLLKSILCKFGRICATGNALMLLESILCEFGRISVGGNALMLLDSILCESERIWTDHLLTVRRVQQKRPIGADLRNKRHVLKVLLSWFREMSSWCGFEKDEEKSSWCKKTPLILVWEKSPHGAPVFQISTMRTFLQTKMANLLVTMSFWC